MLSTFFRHLWAPKSASGYGLRRNRRPRGRSPVSMGTGERLESRAMLAVDVLGSIGTQVLAADDPALKIDLSGFFDETTITGTVVEMSVNVPTGSEAFYIELFDKQGEARERTTPLTVDNFLTYVDDNAYDGSMIHRSVPGFVVQGGGFLSPTVPADQVGSNPQTIVPGPNVLNEPGNSNVRGTIAMAKLGGLPDSATSQWFVNTVDNSGNLDNQNGGFTAFGRVLGTGMNVVDKMAAAPTYDASGYYGNSALDTLPLWTEYTVDPNDPNPPPVVLQPEDFLTLQVDRGLEVLYSVTSTATDVLGVAIDGSSLVLTPQGTNGIAMITVRGTSVADPTEFAEQTFEVRVGMPKPDSVFALTTSARWLVSAAKGSAFETATFAQWSPDVTWTDPVVGDFNGDGLTDVAARTHYGQWWAAINQGDGTTVNWRGSYWGTNVDWQDILVGDFNGDGRDDIAGRTGNGAWFAATASDTNTFTNKLLTLWNANTTWHDVLAGDFNNDGRTDIAGRNDAGQWHVITTNASNEVSSTIAGSWTTKLDWTHVMPGDFNGDGRTDIVARGSNGLWYAALSLDRATPVFNSTYMGAWAKIAWSDVQVGDFNGDGRSDILGRTAGGSWWAGLSGSGQPGFTNSYMGQWAPIAWAAVSVGDFNGDSRSDIIGRVSTNSTNPLWVGLSAAGQFSTAKWGSFGAGHTLIASFVGKA